VPVSERSTRRLVVLQVLVLALLLTLIGRLFEVQLLSGEEYRAAAAEGRTREVLIPAVRGAVLDQAGRPLIGSRVTLVVTVDRHVLDTEPDDGEATRDRLADVLGIARADLDDRLKWCGEEGAKPPPVCWNGSIYQPIPVAKDVSVEAALQIMERRSEFRGVQAAPEAVRTYPGPQGANLAHVLGWVGPVSEEELTAAAEGEGGVRLQRQDLVGRSGLEREYDAILRGQPGVRTLAIDPRGLVTQVLSETEPQAGPYLVTSIDARLQRSVEDALRGGILASRAEGFPADSGAAIVMDATNGRILAMASEPTYDPSVWVGGISNREFRALTSTKAGTPLVSRATQGLFPPASTFKVITTAAAADAGYSLSSSYNCPGSLEVGNRRFRNFESVGYGYMDLRRALIVSCDTIYYQMAYEMWLADGGNSPKERPADPIERMARAFGLGAPTGIDLPEDSPGRVGGREFKARSWEENKDTYCERARNGYPEVREEDPERAALLQQFAVENCEEGGNFRAGDAVNLSIGQGDTVTTPLQLAVAYAAIGNGGTLWQPRVGRAVISADGSRIEPIRPERAGRIPVPRATREYIADALADVVTTGTAAGAFAGFPHDQVRVAGKTGTGEVLGQADTAWFASYAPADDPQYVVVVLISQGDTGGRTAAPVVRRIYEALYGISGSSVDPDRSVLVGGAPASGYPLVRADGTVASPEESVIRPVDPGDAVRGATTP